MNYVVKTIAAITLACAGVAGAASVAQAQYIPRAPNYYNQQETAGAQLKNSQFRAFRAEEPALAEPEFYDEERSVYLNSGVAPGEFVYQTDRSPYAY